MHIQSLQKEGYLALTFARSYAIDFPQCLKLLLLRTMGYEIISCFLVKESRFILSQDCSVACSCSTDGDLVIESCVPFTCEGECVFFDDGSICNVCRS